METKAAQTQSVFQKWLDSLKERDSELQEELVSRLEQRVVTPETVRADESGLTLENVSPGIDLRAVALETIVREGRPALLIRENRIAQQDTQGDTVSKTILERLMSAAPQVEPAIPLVGRIDLENHPGSANYVGTGWLVDRNIIVTNRHVAELIARSDDGKYRFRAGRFGEDLRVSLDYRHEQGIDATAVARVLRVIWIEPDARQADIAFLELDRRGDGTRPEFIPLADEDARVNGNVAVIGYPARAPAHIIPNQAWMDNIYGGTYDVKRIAPGLMGANSRGWATHDCTTLGGNSGSVVLDMETGHAVGLHFAGTFMIENYAVPASTIRKYLKERPWHGRGQPVVDRPSGERPGRPAPAPAGQLSSHQILTPNQRIPTSGVETGVDRGAVSITVPLTITISLGANHSTSAINGTSSTAMSDVRAPSPAPSDIDEASGQLFRERRVEGVYSVWPGYEIKQGKLTDAECLVVSASPDRLETVRDTMPRAYGRFPVEVRPASIDEQMGAVGVAEAPVTSVMYNDDDRSGKGFSFDWIDEEMNVLLHVGPERSWVVLSEFLKGARRELVSSMYEFHAAHIAEAIEQELEEGAALTLVLAKQSHDPQSGIIEAGDFDRSETFENWDDRFRNRFDRIFVPLGSQGLVANSYHIKVTVRDGSVVWLSSGNWKRSSQPLIPRANLDDPRVTSAAGNREWHVVIENDTLADRFRNHIKADFERSLELGGAPEAAPDEILIDVPATLPEAVEFESRPARVLAPREISRRVRVKPLLTPDRKGAVYSNAVLRLIRSATRQLLFQNQYIKMNGADSGFLKQLVDALAEKSQELDDFRIILRSGGQEMAYDLSQLKRRGVDVNQQVRILPNTHTKGIIVDGKRVLLGSHNWSSSGVTLNRDASLIFDDEEVTQYYLEAFELDWDRAREPRFEEAVFESIKPATGDAPPEGFVRMRLSDYLEG
jgi:Phosphatidylserine/phosphatidylglycerophosphate/cardiolipin synthases and related enzymes